MSPWLREPNRNITNNREFVDQAFVDRSDLRGHVNASKEASESTSDSLASLATDESLIELLADARVHRLR